MRAAAIAAWIALAVAWSFSPATAQPPEGMEPGPPHETNLEIGALPPPIPALAAATDGALYDLAAQRGVRPILLHFFRGTW